MPISLFSCTHYPSYLHLKSTRLRLRSSHRPLCSRIQVIVKFYRFYVSWGLLYPSHPLLLENYFIGGLQNSSNRSSILATFQGSSELISVLLQQHMSLPHQDFGLSRSFHAISTSADGELSCISITLQDECRPLKKRRLRANHLPAPSSPLVPDSPSTSSSSRKNGTADAFGYYQKVDAKWTARSVEARKISSQSNGASQPTKIDLDALTYFPPRPSSIRNVTVEDAVSIPTKRSKVKSVRRYKCVRFSLPS